MIAKLIAYQPLSTVIGSACARLHESNSLLVIHYVQRFAHKPHAAASVVLLVNLEPPKIGSFVLSNSVPALGDLANSLAARVIDVVGRFRRSLAHRLT